MTIADPPAERPRLRWYQFRLRTLLLFVLLVAVACSWPAAKAQRARRQARAVEAIRAAGGEVRYDYKFNATVRPPNLPAPAWLVRLLGVDFFADVVAVYYARSFFIMDDDLENLEGLSQLQELDLNGPQVTDAGLEHLKELTKLEYLWLGCAQVTGAGLEHLKGLTNLRLLTLHCPEVTDAGLEHLKGLTNLEELDLRNTQVTDAGLEHLRELTNLRCLRVDAPQVTAGGVQRLRQALPNCGVRRFEPEW
jgi:hypothetical protein